MDGWTLERQERIARVCHVECAGVASTCRDEWVLRGSASSLFALAGSPAPSPLCAPADAPAPIGDGAFGPRHIARSVTRLRPRDAKAEHASTRVSLRFSLEYLF